MVWLDEDSVGGAHVDAFLEQFGVGNEEIVADELQAVIEASSEIFPTIPVVFAKTIFDGDYRELINTPLIPVGKIVGGLPVAIGL